MSGEARSLVDKMSLLASIVNSMRREAYVFGSSVRPAVRASVRQLTAISYDQWRHRSVGGPLTDLSLGPHP